MPGSACAAAGVAADSWLTVQRNLVQLAAAAKCGWTDDTPVPAEFFKRVDLSFEIEGNVAVCSKEIPLTTRPKHSSSWVCSERVSVLIDPGDARTDELTDLFLALDRVHQACGGSGLTIADSQECELEAEEVWQ